MSMGQKHHWIISGEGRTKVMHLMHPSLTYLTSSQNFQYHQPWINSEDWGWIAQCCASSPPSSRASFTWQWLGRRDAVLCEMPLGSISPPFIYIYMRLLGELICCHRVEYHRYVDDTQLCISVPDELSSAVNVVSQCLEAMRIWMGNKGFISNLARLSGFGFGDLQVLEICHLMLDEGHCPKESLCATCRFSWTHDSCSKSKWQRWLEERLHVVPHGEICSHPPS